MAITRSPEEVLADYELAMGPKLGPAFHGLWNDCASLHLKWREYRSVFGTSEARIDLLNAAARGFFGLAQDALWESVILHICRFTDPAKPSGRETLSLDCLPGLIDDFPQRRPVIDLVALAVSRSAFARDWRHRYLAHRDRQLALMPEVKPLAPASREDAQNAIDAITAVLAHVESHYCQRLPTMFEHLSQLGDGEALLRVLRDGIEAREAALRRIGTGEGDESFFTRPLV
jgi:HEPN superfamily AbiU2-like protein